MQTKELHHFLKQLKKNNNKAWFDKNKKEYDALRKDYLTWIDSIIAQIRKFDPAYADVLAKNCIFRINRDVRFSKDKLPYKSNFGASINQGGKNGPHAGYYLHIEPGNCFIAGGMYMPDSDVLAQVRQEIDYNLETFDKIVKAASFKKYFGKLGGETLARPPKGYDESNPAIHYLKHKSYLAYHEVEDKTALSPDYDKYVVQVFKAMKPLLDFLNTNIV